jgi:hypothetical protein
MTVRGTRHVGLRLELSMLPFRHRVATQLGVFPRGVVAHCEAAGVAQLVREENQEILAAEMHS